MDKFRKDGSMYEHASRLYRVRKRGSRSWEVEFDSAKGIWKSTGVQSLEEVEDAVSKMLANLGKKTITGMKFEDFAKNFFIRTDEQSIYEHNKKFGKKYDTDWYTAREGILNNYIMPKFGQMNMSDITDIMIEEWYIRLYGVKSKEPKELSNAVKNRVLNTLSIVLKEAKRKRIIETNPCDTVETLNPEYQKRGFFTVEEIHKLFPQDKSKLVSIWDTLQFALFFSIMVDTGWRCGEVSALKRENFIDNGVYSESSVKASTKKVKESIKTSNKGQPYKVGILSEYTLELYRNFIKDWDNVYLFYFEGFGMNKPYRSNKVLRSACAKVGIDANGRTQHCIRHSFDTYMLNHVGEQGLTRDDILQLMAHTSYRPEYDHRTGVDLINKLSKAKGIIDNLRA